MTMPFFQTAAFFSRIARRERLDVLTDTEIAALRSKDFDQVYERACKIIPDMMFSEFAAYVTEEYYPDLVQVACIGVMKATESWKPDGGSSLTTWAYRLAKQGVWKEIRKQQRWERRHETIDFLDIYDDEYPTMLHKNDKDDDVEGYGERTMRWEAEYSLIRQQLSNSDKALLDMLRDGMTQREIADEAGVSQSTVSRFVVNLQQKILELGESNI